MSGEGLPQSMVHESTAETDRVFDPVATKHWEAEADAEGESDETKS